LKLTVVKVVVTVYSKASSIEWIGVEIRVGDCFVRGAGKSNKFATDIIVALGL
jgi:hypothetical protein